MPRFRFTLLTVAAIATAHGSLQAAGNTINEVSAVGAATQGALISTPRDASTIFYNPAGLTALEGTHFEINSLVVVPELEYERPGAGTSDTGGITPGASLFLASDVLEPVWLGVGLYTPFGREADFETTPATGSRPLRASLLRMDLVPTVAFRPFSNVSVGLGLVASRISFQSEALGLKESGRGYGFTANAGLLVDLRSNLRLGLTYRGPLAARLHGRGSLALAGQRGEFHTKFRFPAVASAGLSWSVSPTLDLGIAYDREFWSYADGLRRDYANPVLASVGTFRFDTDDSETLRLGATYRPQLTHEIHLGFARIGSAFPSQSTTPAIPDADVLSFTVGYSRVWERLTLSATYQYVRSEERTTQSPIFPGRYQIRASVIQVGFSYRWDTD